VALVVAAELTGQVDKKNQLELMHVKTAVVEMAVYLSKATVKPKLQVETVLTVLAVAAVALVNMNVQAELAAQVLSLLDIQSDI
jgi:hypothetical protein